MSEENINLPLQAHLQPPMANGEVLFTEPWQGRVFGMAVALHEAGVFEWSEFQAALIAAIGEWEAGVATAPEDSSYQYYQHFQAALSVVLESRGVVSSGDLHQRASEYADRPHGHDHHHGDSHHHHD